MKKTLITPEQRLKVYKAVRRILVKESKTKVPSKGLNKELFRMGLCYSLRDLIHPFIGYVLQMDVLNYYPEVADQTPAGVSKIGYWFSVVISGYNWHHFSSAAFFKVAGENSRLRFFSYQNYFGG